MALFILADGASHPPEIQWSNQLKRISLFLLPLLFAGAGLLHFLKTDLYVKIVPPHFPSPPLLVYASGIAEIAGAIGLLLPPVRRLAASGLVLLLIAVFPANVYMALHNVRVTSTFIPQWLLWARLPLQAVLIWWILWASRPKRPHSSI